VAPEPQRRRRTRRPRAPQRGAVLAALNRLAV
jgi:hypothetical protein